MGTNALESYNLVESKGALLNIDAPRPVNGISVFRLRVSPILSLSLSFYCDTLNGSIIMASISS